MKGVKDFLTEITNRMEACHFSQPRRQAEDLLCDLLNCSRVKLYTQLDCPLTEQEYTLGEAWLERRMKGEPLAYIHGKMNFYGCPLLIKPSVLIPRQETEILVDKVVKSLKNQDLTGKVLWDVCCGSGCVGIAIKKKFPELTVFLSDVSKEALALARENGVLNEVEVHYMEGDLLEPFHNKKADYIICNPPYISESEYKILENEVKAFEPKLALVGGETGLEFYERLSEVLPLHLNASASVWLEIGYLQGEGVEKFFNHPFWIKRNFENDWSGHNRFFFLENE